MKWRRTGRGTRRIGALALALAAAGSFVFSSSSAPVAARTGDSGSSYLALGDSVTFGYIPNAGYEYQNPENFVGYPAYVGENFDFANTVNAGCPGQTTASFIDTKLPDNGCNAYRSLFPLHVAYGGSQLSFATAFLRANPETQLVTVMLGANDLFLLENRCHNDLSCIEKGLFTVLGRVQKHLMTILKDLRATGFRGRLVVLNYYSPDYTNTFLTSAAKLLGAYIAVAAQTEGARVADVFSAFQKAASSKFAAGNTCKAGLLIALVTPAAPTCDVHPSQSGAKLIAAAVDKAYLGS